MILDEPTRGMDRVHKDGLAERIRQLAEGGAAVMVATHDTEFAASFADRMVIATGLADRQISAMATHLEQKLAEIGVRRIQIEGLGGSDWVLIDTGDIVVHLFKPEARSLYALEKMWGPELDERLDEQRGELQGESGQTD